MQLDLRTLFIVLAILYACLGFVCLFLPYRTPGSHAVTNWGYGLLALAAGTVALALRGAIADYITIDLANALILAAFLFILRSVRPGEQWGSDAFGWSVVGAAVLLLWYFTYLQPDTRARIVVSSAAMALLVIQPVAALIAAVPGEGRRARLFPAACLVGVGLVTLARAVWTIKRGSNADLLAPDFVQFASNLLFAVFAVLATLGVVWIEIEKLRADLARLAMIDPLTAILNRRAFMLEYERELSRCARADRARAGDLRPRSFQGRERYLWPSGGRPGSAPGGRHTAVEPARARCYRALRRRGIRAVDARRRHRRSAGGHRTRAPRRGRASNPDGAA